MKRNVHRIRKSRLLLTGGLLLLAIGGSILYTMDLPQMTSGQERDQEAGLTLPGKEEAWDAASVSAEWDGRIPEYTGAPYTVIHEGRPFWKREEITTEMFAVYSELDELGRCQAAAANICRESMPTEERGEIGMIKPSGWHTVKYPEVIEDLYLYNRCHLIGYQLTGENDNEKNLITGTRYMNIEGMLPFENRVAAYVRRTGNHVLYRVTPVFQGENLVADGVLMEAYSVEDEGEGVCFCVFVYNVQPGIMIDYLTGDSIMSVSEKNVLAHSASGE